MREAVRRSLRHIAGHWDVLLIARAAASAASYAEIERAVTDLLQQVGIWDGSAKAAAAHAAKTACEWQ